MKLIKDNQNLKWTRVRRLFARWVNHARTSNARFKNTKGMSFISNQFWLFSDNNPFGDFQVIFLEYQHALESFYFYNAFSGIAIRILFGFKNDDGCSESVAAGIRMIHISLFEAQPLEKKEPAHIQPVCIHEELCSVIYLIGKNNAARAIQVNGRSIEEFTDLNASTTSPCIWVFLDFVKNVIEGEMSYREFFKQYPHNFIPAGKERKIGWKHHTDVIVGNLIYKSQT